MLKILRKTLKLGIDVIDFSRESLTCLIGFNLVRQRQVEILWKLQVITDRRYRRGFTQIQWILAKTEQEIIFALEGRVFLGQIEVEVGKVLRRCRCTGLFLLLHDRLEAQLFVIRYR